MNIQDFLLRKVIDAKSIYRELSIEHWIKNELFTWVWWLNVFFIIIPLCIWWKIVDRKRILEITVLGLIVNVFASFLDVTGSELQMWVYPNRIIPNAPMMFSFDFFLFPIAIMIIYQYYPKWKGFLVANIMASAAMAFILEPIAVLIKDYMLISWKYIYSFPIYILIAIVSKIILEKVMSHKIGHTKPE